MKKQITLALFALMLSICNAQDNSVKLEISKIEQNWTMSQNNFNTTITKQLNLENKSSEIISYLFENALKNNGHLINYVKIDDTTYYAHGGFINLHDPNTGLFTKKYMSVLFGAKIILKENQLVFTFEPQSYLLTLNEKIEVKQPKDCYPFNADANNYQNFTGKAFIKLDKALIDLANEISSTLTSL